MDALLALVTVWAGFAGSAAIFCAQAGSVATRGGSAAAGAGVLALAFPYLNAPARMHEHCIQGDSMARTFRLHSLNSSRVTVFTTCKSTMHVA